MKDNRLLKERICAAITVIIILLGICHKYTWELIISLISLWLLVFFTKETFDRTDDSTKKIVKTIKEEIDKSTKKIVETIKEEKEELDLTEDKSRDLK